MAAPVAGPATVWLPPRTPVDELGDVPERLRLGELPLTGPLPAQAAEVAVLVLDPSHRDRLAEALPGLPALSVVQTLNAGVDWVPELPAGVLLCSASGVHDGPVAEWVVAVLLAQEKRLPHFLRLQDRAEWDREANLAFGSGPPAGDLAEQTVLVVGYGSIGAALERRLRAFGTQVLRVAGRAREAEHGPVHGPEDLPRLLGLADAVVLLTPATPRTRGMVDAAFLAAMRPGALLVNAARGALVDTPALLEALRAGRVRAALDVTDPEPLPADAPLWSAPGLLLTPHVAGSSAHWRRRAHALVGDQLRRFASGEPLRNVRRR